MPRDQQAAFMKKNVMPNMKPVFQAHDATRYANFSCKTCHGPEFKDPHEYLPKLTMKDGKLTAFAEKPEVAKFMAEQVAPKMAAAMGLPPFDMKTKQGFGCPGCHTVEMK
jgi:cytochrome c553